ncbi:MAG: hypothetical protein LH618_02675 [Saprospiraceae bacterium]|nr:hypothetical protein [Saprospiraceae bacterium]
MGQRYTPETFFSSIVSDVYFVFDEQRIKFHERQSKVRLTKQKKPPRASTAHGGNGFPSGNRFYLNQEILFGGGTGVHLFIAYCYFALYFLLNAR